MCGFAGVVAWDDRYRVDRDALGRMSARIAHRGPDGEGLYLNHEDEVTPGRPQVGLVHRRLAIIDPDPRANQPFTDNRGRWIVFNGEIYNFRELRAELKPLRPDYEWRTDCDTEVLLVAYDVWGERCVEHLNGMFAFAVWDGAKGELFLARDRMGQKPLYVAEPLVPPEKDRLPAIAFGSELPSVTAVPWVRRTVCSRQLGVYLSAGYVGGGKTIYEGVAQILPAEYARVTQAGWIPVRYFSGWLPDPEILPRPDTPAREQTRSIMETAVRRQLVSDVPLGCFLSGGVDSSVIASVMRRAVPKDQPVLTFSIGFDDPRFDESSCAAAVAEHLGTRHHQFVVRPNAAEDLPTLAAAFGQPFGDSSALPTHYLARETRQHVKVALSGDGGDELFGGYDRYRAVHLGRRLDRVPRVLRAMLASRLGRLLPGTHPKSRAVRLKRFVGGLHLGPGERYARYSAMMAPDLVDALVRRPPAQQYRPPPWDYLFSGRYLELLGRSDPVRAALAIDRETYLPDDLLTKVDRASMLHALEVRSPFMDHELVQFAAGLTTDQLLKGGPKRMLREAFAADLPAWVFKRKKMGFAVPIGDWFRNELRPMLHDHLFAADSFAAGHFQTKTVRRLVDEHEAGKADHAQRLYALLMLELWWRTQGGEARIEDRG